MPPTTAQAEAIECNPFDNVFSVAAVGPGRSKWGWPGDLWRWFCCHSAMALVVTVLIMTAVLPPLSHISVYLQWDSVPGTMVLTVVLLAVAKQNGDRIMKTVVFMSLTFHLTFRVFIHSSNSRSLIQDDVLMALRIGVSIAFLSAIMAILVRHLWTSRISGGDSLWVASALYLMLALVFAQAYSLIYMLDEASFRIDPALDSGEGHPLHHRFPIFLYYSTVVITTVGFGDITPLTRMARSLTWFEALTGQLYMVILMGRIVSMQLDFVKSRSSAARKLKKKRALERQMEDPSAVTLAKIGYLNEAAFEKAAKSA